MTADTSVYVTDGGAIHYETAAIDWRIFPAGSLEKDVPFTFALKYSKRQDTLEFYLNGVKSDSSLATPGVGGYQPPSPVADTFCKDPSFANAVSYRTAADQKHWASVENPHIAFGGPGVVGRGVAEFKLHCVAIYAQGLRDARIGLLVGCP